MYSGGVEAAFTGTNDLVGMSQSVSDRASQSYSSPEQPRYQVDQAQNQYMVSDREETEGSFSLLSRQTRNVQTGSKSKKSLKSIVDRLSRQTNLETPNQPVITGYSSSEFQDFNAESSGYNIQGLEYDQNYAQCEEQALDLSMKGPNVSYQVMNSHFESQTDTCGALDLSISKSNRNPSAHQRDNDSPEFVLDLTKPCQWYSPQNADLQSQFSAKGSPVGMQPADMYTQESNERDQDDFQSNHLRVLQFLANHTIQRKVTGEEVDIDLLTCRYCRYSSTEKSCMMAHLTTTHVSKRRRANGGSQRHVNSQSVENTNYVRMAQSSYRGNSDYMNVEQKPKKSPQMTLESSQVSNGHPLSQPSGSGFKGKYPRLIELSPDVRASLNQIADSESLRHNTSILLQGQSTPGKLGREAGHLKHPSSQMTYIIGEGGLRSHPMYGSILQDRLMLHNSNLSPTSSTTSGSTDTTQDVSAGPSTSYTSEAKPRQFKLSHLCKKLAKRMDKQSLSQGITGERRSQSLPSDHLKNVSKRSQRDAVGQTRQDLITQTGNFSCSFCSKTFKRPLSLYGHLKQHSPLLKKYRKGSFQCENCPQNFSSLNTLFLHIQDEHVQDGEFPPQSFLQASRTEDSNPDTKAAVKTASLSQEETHLKIDEASRKRKKMKPYALRQKARRDYLLDHDPMADYLNCEFPFNLQGAPSGVSSSHDGRHNPKVTNKENNQAKRQEKDFNRKLQRKNQKVLKDVTVLLNLRKPNKLRKRNKWRRNHWYSSGIIWKKMCLQSKSRFLVCSFVNVRKYLQRKNDGNKESGFECKHCGKVFKPLLEALHHFHYCHLAFTLKKRSSFRSKIKLRGEPSHLEDVAVPKPAKEKNDLFIKIMQAGVEKFQCKLCLEVIQENKLLARHFKMHKDIFEGGNMALSSEDYGQNTKVTKFEYSESIARSAPPPHESAEEKNQLNPSCTLEISNHMGCTDPANSVNRPWNGLVNQQVEAFPYSKKESLVNDNGGLTHRGISPKLENQSVGRVGSSSKGKYQMSAVFQGDDCAFRSQMVHAKGIHKFVCTICSFGSLYAEEITKHMRKHCKATLECDQCQYQTVEKRFIIRHVHTVHEQRKPYTCELCVYSTAYKHHLKRHYRSHSVDLLTCAKCSFCTLQEGRLQEHMLEHDASEVTNVCEQCNLTFPNPKLLDEHLTDVHNKPINKGTPPPDQENGLEPVSPSAETYEAKFEKYSCNVCQFSSQKSSLMMSHMLKEHMRTESISTDVTLPTLEKNTPQEVNSPGTDLSVQCPQCGFITSHDQLDAHLETHNGDETYACEHCPFETKSLDSLQRHKGKHSKHKVSLTCLQCNQVQTDTLSLRDHTRIHLDSISESNIFRCSLCAFTTHSPQEGEHHLDQHNYVMEYKCQICMYSSPSLSGLTSHRKLHRKFKPTTHTQKRTSPSKRPFQDNRTSLSLM